MSAVKLLPYYTYKDYCHWEGRWELIEGIPYAMSPAPSPEHQRIVAKLITEFSNALKKAGCKSCHVYDFIDIKITDDTIVQPDMSIVCGDILEKFLDFPPCLVVEVLSDTTQLKDRITKFSIYKTFAIEYYVIIDPAKKASEVYQLEKREYIRQEIENMNEFSFNLTGDCNIEVNLSI